MLLHLNQSLMLAVVDRNVKFCKSLAKPPATCTWDVFTHRAPWPMAIRIVLWVGRLRQAWKFL